MNIVLDHWAFRRKCYNDADCERTMSVKVNPHEAHNGRPQAGCSNDDDGGGGGGGR